MIYLETRKKENSRSLPTLAAARFFSRKYCNLSDNILTLISSLIKTDVYLKGDIILREGQVAKDILYVESGLLRQFYYKKDCEVTEHFTCEDNVTFCIESLFEKKPTKLMIEAVETSVIHFIPYQDLIDLAIQYPEVLQLLRKILETSLIISQNKADSWRFSTATDRYYRFIKEYPVASRKASIQHIASYLSMAPESLSRVRGGLKKTISSINKVS